MFFLFSTYKDTKIMENKRTKNLFIIEMVQAGGQTSREIFERVSGTRPM